MLRVIAGRLGGRQFAAPPGRYTRPTADKVREGLFSALGSLMTLEGAQALDLFAGSGALGIEAISRGAAHCTFVEAHARTAGVLRGNLKRLDIPDAAAQAVVARVESWLPRAQLPAPAALVLLDPPYGFAGYEAVLAALAASPAVADGAIVAAEAARERLLRAPAGLEPLRSKRYGDTQVWLFAKRRTGVAHPEAPEGP